MEFENATVNALTVDVEDYFQVEAFSGAISDRDWPLWESRVERNTDSLLDLFEFHNARATFFILGWVAQKFPTLVRKIANCGHEVACHGYYHRSILNQNPDEFRFDIRRAKSLLEDIAGEMVDGYRAPTYSITSQTLWALEILIEEGFRYDSSIFPVHHDRYGIPHAGRFPYIIHCLSGDILEFPPSTVQILNQNLPVAGGGYFRLIPYPLFRWGLRRINRREGQSAIFMIHSWEIDPAQPVLPGTWANIWRHRKNLHLTRPRLKKLLGEFRFAPVREVLQLDEYGSRFAMAASA
jgi:polysaccharide deacetylase family protein (PEP-CTERM system associated)